MRGQEFVGDDARQLHKIRARVALEFWISDRSAKSRSELVAAYSYLCARGSRKFLRPGLERSDLEQVAAIGLLKACDRYDGAVGTPFEAYAWLFVVGELMHFVRDCERLIRPPRKLRALERRAQRAAQELLPALGRKPTRCEVAQHMKISVAELAGVDECRARAVTDSLDSLKSSTYRSISNDREDEAALDRLLVDNALRALNAAERAVIWGVYTAGYSQLEIARRLGYSQRHVSRMHKAALRKIAPLCFEGYERSGH